jgi:hypothetical protein
MATVGNGFAVVQNYLKTSVKRNVAKGERRQ